MKKLLFVMDTFPLGGISKSLLALFSQLEGQYKIDFLLMKSEGLFIPLIPNSINVISDLIPSEFRSPNPLNVAKTYSSLGFKQWLKWLSFSFVCSYARITGGLHKMINTMDVWIAKNTPAISIHYDAAIAYQGGRCIYYIVEKIDADVKIGYVHSNYSVNPTDNMLKPSDAIYFEKLNSIITISQVCVNSLKNEFPSLSRNIHLIENICSPLMIKSMASVGESFDDNFKGMRIVSMGRFDIQIKGIDLAIDATKILKNKGCNFRWYWLGDGEQRPKILELIKEAHVEDSFILLGAKINPYHYVQDADIYVQPSRIEGKSVALDEVKALNRPIIVTCFDSVHDQFTNNVNALITSMEPNDIANNIENLINDVSMREKLVKTLSMEKIGNEEEAKSFISLLTRQS